jgi:hypothetical protein
VTAAALLAVAVAAILVTRPAISHPMANPRDTLPTAAVLRANVDSALDAAAADILAIHRFSSISDGEAVDEHVWLRPAAPSSGQSVERRTVLHDAAGTPVQDFEAAFILPAGMAPIAGPGVGIDATGHAARALRTTGSTLDVDYPSRSWSQVMSGPILVAFPDDLAAIRTEIDAGGWTSARGSPHKGRATIVLTWHEATDAGVTHQLWLDATSYLPTQEIYAYRPGTSANAVIGTVESDYQLLAPSAANVASLSPPIPPGFVAGSDPPLS